MFANRALRFTFALAAGVAAFRLVLPERGYIDTAAFVAGYVILGTFGFLAVRGGNGFRYVFSRTWLFIGLWFAIGLATLILDGGEVPPDWSPEKTWMALGGYGLATVVVTLPLAFGSSGLGFLIARLLSGRYDGPPGAA